MTNSHANSDVSPGWLTDEEQHFWQTLVSTFRSVERNIERELRSRTGLTFGDFTVLIALHETEDGIMHVDDLCHRLKWNHPRALLHTSRMQARGVVSIEDSGPDPDSDYVVVLTGVGRHVFREATPGYVETVRSEIFEQISVADRREMLRSFKTIIDNAERATDIHGLG